MESEGPAYVEKGLWYWVGIDEAVMGAGQTQTWQRYFADVIKVPN
jgi:hypothetical protein